jgi:hypothetical protein
MKKNVEKNLGVKTLEEQMLELSKKNEKIEQLTKDLIKNPAWKIIEDEDEFYAVDVYGEEHLINVELRDKFPNSYFHSPECDRSIIGYDSFSGSIIYNLWTAGKINIIVSEAIFPDFQDTAYGVGSLFRLIEKCDFDGKVPPRHILPQEFINFQNDLQDSMNYWGYEIPLVKANISEMEQRRLHLYQRIDFYERLLEDSHNKSDDFRNSYQKNLDDLIKEFDEIGEERYADVIKTDHERNYTLEAQIENYYKQKETFKLLSKDLLNQAWSISEFYGEYYATDGFCSEFKINQELRQKLPNSLFYPPECDDSIIGYDAQSGAIIYNLLKAGQRLRNCVDDVYPAFYDTIHAIGHLFYQLEEFGLGGKVPPVHIFLSNFINHRKDSQDSIYYSENGLPLFDYNGMKEHYRKALKDSIKCFQKVLEDPEDQRAEYVEYYQIQMEKLTKIYEVLG